MPLYLGMLTKADLIRASIGIDDFVGICEILICIGYYFDFFPLALTLSWHFFPFLQLPFAMKAQQKGPALL